MVYQLDSLLNTKIQIPTLPRGLIPRERLFSQLNNGLVTRLILLSAPAGCGKTSLLCDWIRLRSSTPAFVWVALDEADNDPNLYLQYVIAALQVVNPLIGQRTLPALQSPYPPHPNEIIPGIINQIQQRNEKIALVLDDYHLITNSKVHELTIQLIERGGPGLQMVLASRADPPIPIYRYRAQGALAELRQADLNFTLEEAKIFLQQALSETLKADEIATLHQRTEGWIAGLQMAALSMQGCKDKSAFIRSFSGSHRYVLDYLMEEVLKQQPAAIQEFLFKTSILERMTASLCDALTGRDDSHSVLGQLDKANLFIISLDDERRWYRYHHLFADLLQQRLRQEQRYSVQDIHRQANEWYEKNGLITDAMHHALKAKDYERAAKHIEQVGWEYFTRGELATIIRWITALPKNVSSSQPQLNVLSAWAMAKSGRLNDVETCLQGVDTQTMRGEIAAVQAYVAGVRGNLSQAVELTQIALANLPEENLAMRAIVTQNLGVAYHWSGNPIAATRVLTKAAELTRLADQKFQTLTTLAILGRAYEMQGNLHNAVEIYQNAIDLASEASQQPAPFAGMAHIGIAGPLYERDDLESAMQHAVEGIRLSKMGGFVAYLVFGYALLAKIHEAKGDHKQATKMLQKAEWYGQGSDYDLVMALVAEIRVRIWLRQKNMVAANDWVQSHLADSIDDLDAAGEIEQIVVTRVLTAQGKFNQALNLLISLLDAAKRTRRMESVLQILISQALIYQSQQKIDPALSVLEQALTFGEAGGYLRIFVDHGEPMGRLLRCALARSIVPNYVARLLAIFDEQAKGVSTRTETLVDPLSERETEVLRHIVAGLSNPEIAEELTIAESTVKTHINHIYSKLSVKTRTQAIAIAREQEIL